MSTIHSHFPLVLCFSSEESCSSSGLSMHSSAGVLSMGSPADGLDAGSEPKVEPLDVSLLGQNLETLKGKDHTYLSVDLSESKFLSLVSMTLGYFYRYRGIK